MTRKNPRFTYTLSLFAVLSLTAAAQAQTKYAIADLGTLPGGTSSTALGLSQNGYAAGISMQSGASGQTLNRAFFYNGTSLVDVGTLPGGVTSTAASVNSAGQVVGVSDRSGGGPHAFLYAPGASGLTDLGTLPGGTFSSAVAINESGTVAGSSDTTGTNFKLHAFRLDGTTYTDLKTLGGASSTAMGLNNSGQIVGVSGYSGGGRRAFLSTPGAALINLGTLPGGGDSTACSINDGGRVAGYALNSSNHRRAFLTGTGGSGLQDLGTLPGDTDSSGRAVNKSGDVVGESDHSSGSHRAFLYKSGGMINLNTLLPSGSGWKLTDANAINDTGQIAGVGVHTVGGVRQVRAFILTPYPNASSLSPSSIRKGAAAFTLTVKGGHFTGQSVVRWQGSALATTFLSGGTLHAQVPASLVAAAGMAAVTVSTPNVATTSALTFTITP